MLQSCSFSRGFLLWSVLTLPHIAALAAPLRSITTSSQPSPVGGGGDSYMPIVSPNGRYVLFASTANNLMLNTNGNPIPLAVPPRLNVYLRDRTNGAVSLASVNLSGLAGGNGDSTPMGVSTNGRYVLFESIATDLVAGDTNNASDIFVRDLAGGTTALVSTSTNGGVGNGLSRSSVFTPDGRYVAFVSEANNLVGNDTNKIADVFLRDLQSGTTTVISAGAANTNNLALSASSEAPEISADGRYVVFSSTATNLVPGIRTPRELYLRDTAGPATTWVSGDARNIAFSVLGTSNIFSFNHALSADGKLVAFECTTNPLSASYPRGLILRYSVDTGLTDLVHTNAYASVTMPFEDARTLEMSPDGRFIVFVGNTNGISGSTTCIYRWDALSGATVLVSGDLAGNVQTGSTCQWPSMDSSGRYVSFLSTADNLVTNSVPGEYHVYIRDIDAGITTLLDAGTNTSLFGPAIVPKISSDGRFVAFESPDSSLVPNDHNHDYDIFLRDLLSNTVEVVSAHDPALASTSGAGPSSLSSLSLSGDGRLLAFSSDADDLVVADANGFRDIFVRDLRFGTNDLVSISTNGLVSDGQSTEPSISGNGRYVAFTSTADNLADGDTNHARDVFVRDLETGTTTLVSLNLAGTGPGNRESYSPSITADGRYVLFRSLATDLAPHTFGGSQNLFLRDLQLGTNYALTLGGVLTSSLSPNGRFVSFANSAICLWDIASATLVYSNVIHNSGAVIGVSPDGQRIVYFDAGSLKAVDLVSSSNWTINSSVYNLQHLGLRFTADGRFLAYHAAPSAPPLQIFLYDFEAGTNILISEAFDGSGVGNSDSDSPWITPDGRFVAYRSVASNLVAGAASNGQPNIFLYDRLLATTTLLSASRYTSNTADARSFFPVLSDDGRTLAFESWASDLVANDFNHGGDVFVYNFLIASVSAGSGGAGPTLTWPARPGETYSVEFKNSLDDATWQPVTGTVTITGTQAQLTDLAPSLTQRFYRIVAH